MCSKLSGGRPGGSGPSSVPLTPVSSWPSCFTSLGFGFPIYKMVVGRMTSRISLTAWNPVPTLLKTPPRCSPPCNSPGTVAWQMGSKASARHPQVQPSPLSCQHFFCLSGGWCGCQCCNQMPPLPLPSYPAQLSHSLGGAGREPQYLAKSQLQPAPLLPLPSLCWHTALCTLSQHQSIEASICFLGHPPQAASLKFQGGYLIHSCAQSPVRLMREGAHRG